MKLVYVIAMGHSGSTLADCILGTHPDFISSGELRYLNWQLYRTMDKKATVKGQDICTCEQDFRDCPFWSEVFIQLKRKTGNDIIADPTSFDTAYFNQFAYQDRNGFARSYTDKVKGYITREWIEQGWTYKVLPWSKYIDRWLSNNWILYETMAEVGEKPVVIDSSKHLMIALLLQQYEPDNVTLLFLHRSVEALAASAKRWAAKKGKTANLEKVVEAKRLFEKRIAKYKQKVKNLNYIDAYYETMVSEPANFLESVVHTVGINTDYKRQTNESFFIEPSQQHLVAGNPMRYRGKQQVRYDERWKNELSAKELQNIQQLATNS